MVITFTLNPLSPQNIKEDTRGTEGKEERGEMRGNATLSTQCHTTVLISFFPSLFFFLYLSFDILFPFSIVLSFLSCFLFLISLYLFFPSLFISFNLSFDILFIFLLPYSIFLSSNPSSLASYTPPLTPYSPPFTPLHPYTLIFIPITLFLILFYLIYIQGNIALRYSG